jgi:hypothetical protein
MMMMFHFYFYFVRGGDTEQADLNGIFLAS